jgi:hypothetical protein
VIERKRRKNKKHVKQNNFCPFRELSICWALYQELGMQWRESQS